MWIKVLCFIIVSTLLTTAGNSEVNDAVESECSEDTDSSTPKSTSCLHSVAPHANGYTLSDKFGIKQDIESEYIFNKEKSINQKGTLDIWDQICDYASAQGTLLTYSIICIFIFCLVRGLMNFRDTGKDEIKDNQDFKEGIKLQNKLIHLGDLVRPMDRLEILYAVGATRKSFGTHQAIWLRSTTPIDENVMSDALTELTRQMPFLQLCIKLRYFQFWFKRMDKMEIDFTAVEPTDVLTAYRNETNFAPNVFEGPLWRARLLKCSPIPDQADGRKFKSVLIFTIAHCITDGFTNNLICSEAVRLYNLLICKQPIPPAPMMLFPPLGDNYPSYNILKCIALFLLQMMATGFNVYNVQCMSPKIITESRMKIAMELDELTEEETSSLLIICKSKNLTLNSFLSTAAAYAYVQTAHEFSKSTLTQMNVSIIHNVNLRRYVKEDSDKLAGCYVSFDTTTSSIDLKKSSQFWKEALELQNSLKSHITSNEPLLYSSIFKYFWWTLPMMEWKTYISSYECALGHFSSTNMGNISEKLPPAKDNEPVEIYDILRSTSGLHIFTPLVLTFHTFRNVLKFSVDVGTVGINEAPARYFFSSLMNLVRSACKEEMFSN